MSCILKYFSKLLVLMLLVSIGFTVWGTKIFGSVGGYIGSLIGIWMVSVLILKSLFRRDA